jgi:hypothetical protein
MQHCIQAFCILLILCILQFIKNKKLMQAGKIACRSGKKVVNLHRVRQANRKE